jgi:hypothetical protein
MIRTPQQLASCSKGATKRAPPEKGTHGTKKKKGEKVNSNGGELSFRRFGKKAALTTLQADDLAWQSG